MIRKLLLLLVVTTILQNTSYGQQAAVLANCFYQSAPYPGRIVIRLAIRNNTASGQDFELSGIRVGIQYNAAAVTPAGYTSYLYENGVYNSSLNDASKIDCVGDDTNGGGYNGGAFSTYPTVAETSRVANINTGGTKVMQRRYISRSNIFCSESWGVPPGTFRIMMDIYFTLNDPNQLAYYGLNNPAYGFDSPDFIAQSMNAHNANLYTNKSEIGIVLIRQGNCGSNPYQPFSWTTQNCTQDGKVNPVTIEGDTTVRFISPINGVLAGKAVNANLEEKEKDVLVQWESENNELVDYFEVERKDETGQYKTIGLVMSDNKNTTVKYQFKDKITIRDVESFYRVKAVGVDKVITYSDVKRIRLNSEQQISVKVFPNPSSDNIRIGLPDVNGIYVCRMYSAEGRMVQVTNVSSMNPTINIKSLNTGAYFMELYNPKSGKRFYTQFSKQ